ncbi:hypothetical protein PAXINDRAFT_9487 [Paxillus involutus ATCC 200175]|nr:hypothetical protein PAXINDRAFT_9487 [Paxillus involutus ATCC 200175]
MPERQPYQGPALKLVLAFDVGTTYSGVSYSILDPGEPPIISWVTRFPATGHVGGNSKIPSIVYYDKEGTAQAFGSEALQESIIEKAEDEGWVKLEWWKLHLRPKNMLSNHVSDRDIPVLPPSVTAMQVLGDFMRYLFKCTKTYFEGTHASGRDMWQAFGNNIDFVLSHPNGWEGPQQTQIRRAALITEGEATLHFYLGSGNTSESFNEDQGVMVIDAGRGTIDVSSYYMTTSPTRTFQEIAPAECRLEASVFVCRRARQFLHEKLSGSKFGTKEDIDQMTGEFDETTRHRFSNPTEPSYIRFGTVRDRAAAFNIKCGQLKLPGTEVATLFEPSVQAIFAAVENQRKLATKPINSIFLDHVKLLDLNFCRPDSQTNKAVAAGAIAFYLDHKVSARVAKFTYGTRCAIEFNKTDEQHRLRAASAIPRPSGRTVLPNAFSAILHKGTTVSEAKEFRKDFITEGNSSNPRWTDSEPGEHTKLIADVDVDVDPTHGIGMFSNLCTVHADTSQVSKTLSPRRGFAGLQFYRQQFSIVLMFGLTELQAQISWKKDGEEKRGPATVVFDQVVEEI